jgi:hypothetical protein
MPYSGLVAWESAWCHRRRKGPSGHESGPEASACLCTAQGWSREGRAGWDSSVGRCSLRPAPPSSSPATTRATRCVHCKASRPSRSSCGNSSSASTAPSRALGRRRRSSGPTLAKTAQGQRPPSRRPKGGELPLRTTTSSALGDSASVPSRQNQHSTADSGSLASRAKQHSCWLGRSSAGSRRNQQRVQAVASPTQ